MAALNQAETPAASPGNARLSGVVHLWAAVLIFAAANSVVRLLTELGALHPVEGRNAISFCNVLFVGNLCACATLFVIYRQSWNPTQLRSLTRGDWISLIVLALLSGALAPALIFLAIENTAVTNVILVARIEPFLLLFLSVIFLRESFRPWIAAGTVIALVGVAIAFLLQSADRGAPFGKGELQAAFGAAVLAVSTALSKTRLKRIPLGIFTVVRTGLGAVIFFAAATYLFGPSHFMDAFNPFLWQLMLVYGAVVVVGGQFFWFTGIKGSQFADVSLATSFSPIAGILFAFLLLGERPDTPILVAAAVILLGTAIAYLGERSSRPNTSLPVTTQGAVAAEAKVTFKGV